MTRRYIAVTADIFDHNAFDGEIYSRREAWLWLIANAAWRPHRSRCGSAMIDVGRGQVVAGRAFLSQKWGWGAKKVRTFLDFLESENMIEKAASKGRFANVITICNYDVFQSGGVSEGPVEGQLRASWRAISGPVGGPFGDDETDSKNNEIPNPQSEEGPVGGPFQGQLEEAKRATQYKYINNTKTAQQDSEGGKARTDAKRTKAKPAKQLQLEGGNTEVLDPEVESCFDLWNESARRSGFKTVRARSADLRQAIRARLDEFGLDGFKTMLRSLEADDFRCGRKPGSDGRTWRADISYALRNGRDGDVYAKLINSAPDDAPSAPEDPYAHLRSANEMQWRIRINAHAHKSWPAAELGPPPCSKSCIVPSHIIEELGLKDAYSSAGIATNTHDPRHPIHRAVIQVAA